VQPDKRYLWHLITPDSILKKLPTFLKHGMYFPKLSAFGDQSEGQTTESAKNLLNKTFGPVQAKNALALFKRFADWSFASCWHESDGEPREEMWKFFGGNHKCIAIRFSPSMLTSCFNQALLSGKKRVVLSGSVEYVDHVDPNQGATIGNFLPTCYSVRQSYSHEQETRLLVCLTDTDVQQLVPMKHDGDFTFKTVNETENNAPHVQPLINGGNGLIIPIDSTILIDQIVVGRNATPDTLASMLAEVGKALPGVQVVRET